MTEIAKSLDFVFFETRFVAGNSILPAKIDKRRFRSLKITYKFYGFISKIDEQKLKKTLLKNE